MIGSSLYCYLLSLSQPTRFLDWLKFNIPIWGFYPQSEIRGVFWKQSVLWAWFFRILGLCFESLLFWFILLFLINFQGEQRSFDLLLRNDITYTWGLSFLFLLTGLRILSFPFILSARNLFTQVYLSMVRGLWDQKKVYPKEIWHIVALENTSYVFLGIPIFGRLAQEVSSFILLYKSLRWRMGWGRVKTFWVIILPSFFMGSLVILGAFLILA